MRLAERMGTELGVPGLTSAGALAKVLRRLGRSEVVVLSPYPDWLTSMSVSFWTGLGLKIRRVDKVAGTGKIYDLDSADIKRVLKESLRRLSPRDEVTIAILGTGAPSLSAIDAFAPTSEIPIVSSNLASAWACLDSLDPSGELLASSESPSLQLLNKRIHRNSLKGPNYAL